MSKILSRVAEMYGGKTVRKYAIVRKDRLGQYCIEWVSRKADATKLSGDVLNWVQDALPNEQRVLEHNEGAVYFALVRPADTRSLVNCANCGRKFRAHVHPGQSGENIWCDNCIK